MTERESVTRVYAVLVRLEAERKPFPTTRELAKLAGFSVSTTHRAVVSLLGDGKVVHHCGWGVAHGSGHSDDVITRVGEVITTFRDAAGNEYPGIHEALPEGEKT